MNDIYFWWALISVIALLGEHTSHSLCGRSDKFKREFPIWVLLCSIPILNGVLAFGTWVGVILHKLAD